MNRSCGYFSVVTLCLIVFSGATIFAQDNIRKCKEIEAAIASSQRSMGFHLAVAAVSDRFAFYDAAWKKIRAAVAVNKVADGLGAIIQRIDPAVLDIPDVGGRPKANASDLLSFQSRLNTLLGQLMQEVHEFDPGDARDKINRDKIELFSVRVDDLREEYNGLKCGALETDRGSFPDIGGAWESNYTDDWKATSISQAGKTLVFTNEFGDSSPGVFVSATSVKATKWEGGLGATISPDGKTIKWSNGTTWRRK